MSAINSRDCSDEHARRACVFSRPTEEVPTDDDDDDNDPQVPSQVPIGTPLSTTPEDNVIQRPQTTTRVTSSTPCRLVLLKRPNQLGQVRGRSPRSDVPKSSRGEQLNDQSEESSANAASSPAICCYDRTGGQSSEAAADDNQQYGNSCSDMLNSGGSQSSDMGESNNAVAPALTLEQREQAYEEARRRIFGSPSLESQNATASANDVSTPVMFTPTIGNPRPLRPRPFRPHTPSSLQSSLAQHPSYLASPNVPPDVPINWYPQSYPSSYPSNPLSSSYLNMLRGSYPDLQQVPVRGYANNPEMMMHCPCIGDNDFMLHQSAALHQSASSRAPPFIPHLATSPPTRQPPPPPHPHYPLPSSYPPSCVPPSHYQFPMPCCPMPLLDNNPTSSVRPSTCSSNRSNSSDFRPGTTMSNHHPHHPLMLPQDPNAQWQQQQLGTFGTNQIGTNQIGTNQIGTNQIGTSQLGTNPQAVSFRPSHMQYQPDPTESPQHQHVPNLITPENLQLAYDNQEMLKSGVSLPMRLRVPRHLADNSSSSSSDLTPTTTSVYHHPQSSSNLQSTHLQQQSQSHLQQQSPHFFQPNNTRVTKVEQQRHLFTTGFGHSDFYPTSAERNNNNSNNNRPATTSETAAGVRGQNQFLALQSYDSEFPPLG